MFPSFLVTGTPQEEPGRVHGGHLSLLGTLMGFANQRRERRVRQPQSAQYHIPELSRAEIQPCGDTDSPRMSITRSRLLRPQAFAQHHWEGTAWRQLLGEEVAQSGSAKNRCPLAL